MKFWFIPVVCTFSRNTGNQLENFGWYWYRYARQLVLFMPQDGRRTQQVGTG